MYSNARRLETENMTTKQVLFQIGIGFDKVGRPILPVDADAKIREAGDFLTGEYGGVTVTRGVGSWRNSANVIIREASVGFMVIAEVTDRDVQDAGEFLRQLFRQDTVLVSVADVTVMFLTGKGKPDVDETNLPEVPVCGCDRACKVSL